MQEAFLQNEHAYFIERLNIPAKLLSKFYKFKSYHTSQKKCDFAYLFNDREYQFM